MEQVPILSIAFMALSCGVAFLVPIGLFLYLRRRGADIAPFFVGCIVFALFALTLESLAHRLILGSSLGERIQGDTLLFALYGGAMAALFEETGRLLAFKTLLRKRVQEGRDIDALMYGAGHGGMEAMLIVGSAMVNNIVYSVMINTGRSAELITSAGETLAPTVEAAIQTLLTTPS